MFPFLISIYSSIAFEDLGRFFSLLIYTSGSQPLSDRGPVNSFFYKTRARYN
jgi:hypothetical protein